MERVTGTGGVREEIRQGVWEALGRGAVVVTANERVARTLRRAHDELRRADETDRWEPAAVLSWAAWTGSLWRRMLLEGGTRALLLNAAQEHAVWRGVLTKDEATGPLRGVDALAEMAAATWASLCAYADVELTRSGAVRRVSERLEDENTSADTAAFARWLRAFEERCEAEGLQTTARLHAVLAAAVRAGKLKMEGGELLLVGFDWMTPAQEGLLRALRTVGVSASHAASGVDPERRVLTSAADETEELRACARWAAASLERAPESRIAVIVPDVSTERPGIERVFRELLAPELELIATNEDVAPYEFSLGRALAETPMISVGLELLRWTQGTLPPERVSGLLVSEYFAARNGERGARAEFDAFELRRVGMLRPELSVGDIVRIVTGSGRRAKLTGLVGALRRMENAGAGLHGESRSYGRWAQAMRDLLAGAGWGAAGAESSEEFQARERWESALDAMSTLDFEGREVAYGDALRAIEWIAGKTVFAPESRSKPVQVMGPLEAAGSDFDGVWFLRAGEMTWPPAMASLPLLPWGLQRDLRMPGTDAGRDLEAARAITGRIAASGREVVVSFSRMSGEARQRSAAVVRELDLEEVELFEIAGAEAERDVVMAERVEEDVAIRPLPEGVVRGGVRVLELQAACGFRAFAEHRLWSSQLEDRVLGLNSREGGTAVHRALERFWGEVRSQAKLIAMSPEERSDALSRAIEEGLGDAVSMSKDIWDEAYVEVQRERLRRLLHGWLEKEIARPAFVVQQQEARLQDVQIGPLRLQLRVDRVDLVDEEKVLIDYKTGAATTAEWLGERPDAPQVPLYAILAAGADEERSPDDALGGAVLAGELGAGLGTGLGTGLGMGLGTGLGAVAFGSVRAGRDAGLKGFAVREGLLPGKLARMDGESFEGQVERWQEVLERLAGEFAAGDARVRPKNYPGTCQRCGQRILCRLDAGLLEEVEEEGEGG